MWRANQRTALRFCDQVGYGSQTLTLSLGGARLSAASLDDLDDSSPRVR